MVSKKAGKDIQFESRTELKVLKALEKMPEVMWYDVQCIQFPYKFKGKKLTYHPDIICKVAGGRTVVIEVKPMRTVALLATFRKAIVARQECEKNGWHYVLLSPSEGTIENMACWTGPEEVEKELVKLVGDKSVSNYKGVNWRYMKAFMQKHNLDMGDMTAIALRNDLAFTEQPYLCGKLPDDFSWSTLIPALATDRASLNRDPIRTKGQTLPSHARSILDGSDD